MKQRHPEHALQRACVQYLRTLPPPPKGPWWTAIAPLPGTSARQGAQAKQLGLQAGAPDLILMWRGVFFGIELKAAGGRTSATQNRTAGAIYAAGGNHWVIRSTDDFVQAIARVKGWAGERAA